MKEWKKGERSKRGISLLSLSFRSSPFLFFKPELEGFSWSSLCATVLTSLSYLGWLVLEGKNGRFIASLMVLQILVFYPNVPGAVNFAETSNSFSMISVWFYYCIR